MSSDVERLAVAQAIFKSVSDLVSTKDPDSLRGRCDAEMLEAYAADGVKSRDVRLGDGREKVGTYSVRVSKAAPEKHVTGASVVDPDACLDWVWEHRDDAGPYVRARLAEIANAYFGSTGEVPAGCYVSEQVELAQPERATGTTLRIDPEKVAHALHGELPQVVAGLLGGDER